MKLDLLTNATVVDDATIRFVSSNKFKDTLRSSADKDEVDKEKSKEPDYDEDQLEEEQQEQEAEDVTTNCVF